MGSEFLSVYPSFVFFTDPHNLFAVFILYLYWEWVWCNPYLFRVIGTNSAKKFKLGTLSFLRASHWRLSCQTSFNAFLLPASLLSVMRTSSWPRPKNERSLSQFSLQQAETWQRQGYIGSYRASSTRVPGWWAELDISVVTVGNLRPGRTESACSSPSLSFSLLDWSING